MRFLASVRSANHGGTVRDDGDVPQNEAAYRNGIATENGILIRKPTWKCVAKLVVEISRPDGEGTATETLEAPIHMVVE